MYDRKRRLMVDFIPSMLGEDLFLCEGKRSGLEICESTRIGIGYAEEYKDVTWRFHMRGDKFISKSKT
jgi:3-methyladenine DNA glycosylase Mpg